MLKHIKKHIIDVIIKHLKPYLREFENMFLPVDNFQGPILNKQTQCCSELKAFFMSFETKNYQH